MTTLAAARQYAMRDVEAIQRWFLERPTLNLGAPVPKGYVVVDVDARRRGGRCFVSGSVGRRASVFFVYTIPKSDILAS